MTEPSNKPNEQLDAAWLEQFGEEIGEEHEGAGTSDLEPKNGDESDDDQYAHLGLGFGPDFSKKFLIALIRAHPSNTKSDETRLKQAMLALFGREPTRWPLPGDREDQMLLWMADRKYQRALTDRKSGTQKKKFSVSQLAREALIAFGDNPESEVTIANSHKLARKFRGTYPAKAGQKNAAKIDHAATYSYRANEHDYVAETVEQQDLIKIKKILELYKVPMAIDP